MIRGAVFRALRIKAPSLTVTGGRHLLDSFQCDEGGDGFSTTRMEGCLGVEIHFLGRLSPFVRLPIGLWTEPALTEGTRKHDIHCTHDIDGGS